MSIARNIVPLLILAASISVAQTRPETAKDIEKHFGQSTYPVRVTIKPSKPSFSRHEPFVFAVTFTNTSDAPIFLNTTSSFGFGGFLRTIKKDSFYATWYWMSFEPEGASRPPRREDYTELGPGKSYTITVASKDVRMISPNLSADVTHPSWDDRKAGRLKVFLKYSTGTYFYGRQPSEAFFARQIEGLMNSNEITIFVK